MFLDFTSWMVRTPFSGWTEFFLVPLSFVVIFSFLFFLSPLAKFRRQRITRNYIYYYLHVIILMIFNLYLRWGQLKLELDVGTAGQKSQTLLYLPTRKFTANENTLFCREFPPSFYQLLLISSWLYLSTTIIGFCSSLLNNTVFSVPFFYTTPSSSS